MACPATAIASIPPSSSASPIAMCATTASGSNCGPSAASRGAVWFAALGAVAAAAVLWLVWDHVTEEPGPTWQMAVIVAAVGGVLGAGVFLGLHEGLARFDGGTGRVIAACALMAIAGGVVGAAVGIPAFGLVGGISLALVGMAALGMALPLLLVAGENVGSSG